MKYIIIIFLSLVYSTFNFSNAYSSTRIFKGTIGKYPIVIKINLENEYSRSTYYYENVLKDIVLFGTETADSIYLHQHQYIEKDGESFQLKKKNNGGLTGQWTKGKKKLIVDLKPIEDFNLQLKTDRQFLSKGALDYVEDIDIYDILKINKLDFREDSITTFNNKKLVWYTERMSNISFFRLGEGIEKEKRNNVNRRLEIYHYMEAMNFLNCSSDIGEGLYEFQSQVSYLSDDLISIGFQNYYYCGGAHPDGGIYGLTMDLNNTNELTFNDIISFDGKTMKCTTEDCSEWYQYLQDVQGVNVVNLLEQEYNIKYTETEEDDYCQLSNSEYWMFLQYYLTDSGIIVIPYLPRVARACEDEYFIPYGKIIQYKNPAFNYSLK